MKRCDAVRIKRKFGFDVLMNATTANAISIGF